MNIQIKFDAELLKHLTKFQNITDEEIEQLASEGEGLDAEQALLLHLERDFVRSFNKAVVEELSKLKKPNMEVTTENAEVVSKKKSKYNTTDLDPEHTFERHVYHRDQFAHYLRWTHVLNQATIGETIADFGCGKGSLLEVFYRNKFKCKKYVGMDIRKKTIEEAKEKYNMVPWAEFHAVDLILDPFPYDQIQADKVISFEVAEHVGKQNIDVYLQHFKACGNDNATYYLSTPNYDEKVGAAGNHTYDSGDGRGIAVHEFEHKELQAHIEKYFTIEKKYGTFASQTHYKPLLNDWQQKMFDALREYYDSNLVANIMAPFFPEQARNCLWVLKNK